MARSKGAGTLIKRGKYWQCRVVVDGKPMYKATGTTSKVKAKEILEEFARPFRDRDAARRVWRSFILMYAVFRPALSFSILMIYPLSR